MNFQNIWQNSRNFIISCEKSCQQVEQEINDYARSLYNDLMRGNSDCMAMFDFTFYCAKEKYNIYPMMYIYKLHSEILKIVQNEVISIRKAMKLDYRREIKKINKKILDLYDTEENINLIFKLLCESCDNEYPYADDVFTILCCFLSNLMEVRAVSVQNKLMILFEKRPYAQNFFKQLYTYLMSYSYKLNTGNHVEAYGSNFGSISKASYLINENREYQILRIIALACSRLNYAVKDYMSFQTYADQSYDLAEATTFCMKALLPYMHYQRTYDNLLMCLQVILEFVDGDARSDMNTQKVVDFEFITVAASILNLNYYNHPSNDHSMTLENLETTIKFNFTSLGYGKDRLSLFKNCNFVLDWLNNDYMNAQTQDTLKANNFALLPNDGSVQSFTQCNFRISLLKIKTLECLLECINSGELVNSNAFLKIYTKIDPMIFRKLFCFQAEMFRYYHQEKYRSHMLNKSENDSNDNIKSGFIIEIGCLAYALLIKIDEFHSKARQDMRYRKMLISNMPEEVRNDVPFSDSTLFQVTELIGDVIKRTKRICRPNSLNFTTAEQNTYNDARVKKYMKFYADITSQIDILIDNKLVTYTFILLPYCRLSSRQQKEEFLQLLDRSSPQAK